MVKDQNASVSLLIGEEAYLKSKAVEELKSRFLNDDSSGDLDYKVFYGDETSARDILDYIDTPPLLSSRRFALVKYFDKLPDDDRFAILTRIRKPQRNAYLVLDSDDETVLKGHNDISLYADIKRFKHQTVPEASSHIRRLVSSWGKKMDPSAIELLSALWAHNILLLTQEVEKIVTFVGERNEITLSDVEGLIGRSLVNSSFDIFKAIAERDAKTATHLVKDLIASGEKSYGLIGLLSWQVRRILKAKTLILKGATDYSIADILGVNKAQAKDFFRQAHALSLDQIRSCLKMLLRADLDIKNSKFNPALILEVVMLRLCLGW